MRISEAYEHEPLLACQSEETGSSSGCNCSCNKVGTQYVNVSAPLTLTPVAVAGTMNVTCQGAPSVTCVTSGDGSSCIVTVTQRVSVSIPIRFGVDVETDDPTIGCADGSMSCGCR